MKPSFQAHIYCDKTNLKNVSIKSAELKKRIKYILSLVCDFSTQVSIKFCDKPEMLHANNSFRKKKYATDVLSFPNSPFQNQENFTYLGDILICVPVCLEQSKKAKITLCQELEKMVIHGIVHLKGFDHERNTSAFHVMNSLETILQKELIKNFKKPNWCQLVL